MVNLFPDGELAQALGWLRRTEIRLKIALVPVPDVFEVLLLAITSLTKMIGSCDLLLKLVPLGLEVFDTLVE